MTDIFLRFPVRNILGDYTEDRKLLSADLPDHVIRTKRGTGDADIARDAWCLQQVQMILQCLLAIVKVMIADVHIVVAHQIHDRRHRADPVMMIAVVEIGKRRSLESIAIINQQGIVIPERLNQGRKSCHALGSFTAIGIAVWINRTMQITGRKNPDSVFHLLCLYPQSAYVS